MKYRTTLLVIASVVVLIAISFIAYKQSVDKVVQPPAEQPTAIVQTEPQKTEFGTKLPTDFPIDIPIEEGVEVEQSYSLNYTGQKQMTIVFPSTKTVKENYNLYIDFLQKQGWSIINKNEGKILFGLYAIKDNNEMNITITKDNVSISILKK